MAVVLNVGDLGGLKSVGCDCGFIPDRLGVLFEWSRERLRLMAGGVALSSAADDVEIEAEEGPVTIEAFDDLRFSLGVVVKTD